MIDSSRAMSVGTIVACHAGPPFADAPYNMPFPATVVMIPVAASMRRIRRFN